MTSQDPAVNAELIRFNDHIESLKQKDLSANEVKAELRAVLDQQFVKAAECESQREPEKAVQNYYLCMAMIKRILELSLISAEEGDDL